MSWRYLPPVHSPVTRASLTAGFLAAVRGDRGARERVQRALGAFYGVTRVLLTDSGTSALTLAMGSAMATTGRKLIALPGYCCYDLVTALNGAGAEVVFYDIDPATLNPDWSSFASALAAGPAAVVVAHLYGLPVDMPRVMDLAEHHHTVVIEDSAQGIGGSIAGRPLGAFGHLRVLSFGRGKGVTAGRGGALLVGAGWRGAIEQGTGRAGRGFGALGPLTAQAILARPWLYRLPAMIPMLALGETKYRDPGPIMPMSEAAAAIVEQNWKARQREGEARRRNATRLITALEHYPAVKWARPVKGGESGWLRLPVMICSVTSSDPHMTEGRSLGIMPGYPRSLDTLAATPTQRSPANLPGAAQLAAELWTLPTHSLLSERDLVRLESWLHSRFSTHPVVRAR
jgi:dTDP-4-amino-4,6-dideoxygalactose transaminase